MSAAIEGSGSVDSAAMPNEDLDEMISIRVSKDDVEAMKRLADRLPIKPITIARIALRLGLDALTRDPGKVFGGKTAVRSPKKKAKRRGAPHPLK